jgi:hypothetical protein
MSDDAAELNKFFEALLTPKPPRPEGEDFFALTIAADDDADPNWGTAVTALGDWDTLCGQFDMAKLPPSARLLQGKAARQYLRKVAREEARYQAERRIRRAAGGGN